MPNNKDTALTSYANVSQALISLGLFYYENYHDNPSPETKSLIEAIDKSLSDVQTMEPQVNAGCAANQSSDGRIVAASTALLGNEPVPMGDEGDSMPVEKKAPRQCPYCDAPLPDDAKFCGTCGSSLY